MKRTAADIIRKISIEVEGRKLPMEVMVRDIQMMRFKIRSVIGDISSLQTMQYDFIRSLWKIGRIDDIVSNSLHELDEDDQDALIEYFNIVESHMQESMRQALSSLDPGQLSQSQKGTHHSTSGRKVSAKATSAKRRTPTQRTPTDQRMLKLEIFKDVSTDTTIN